jgi:hypothetical protein
MLLAMAEEVWGQGVSQLEVGVASSPPRVQEVSAAVWQADAADDNA